MQVSRNVALIGKEVWSWEVGSQKPEMRPRVLRKMTFIVGNGIIMDNGTMVLQWTMEQWQYHLYHPLSLST